MSPRAVVTGGAGFLGSHLCDRLLAEGWDVVCLDSLLTGSAGNLGAALASERFEFRHHDVTGEIDVGGAVDWVLHLASPASPRDYLQHPIHTLKVGAVGTLRALGLAKAKRAGFLLASTSEVYGDPALHPQPEHYWGNVNPVGPRGVYDEAKRFAEAATMAYHRAHGVPVRVARIFNTFGPRLRRDDGRAVPAFVRQALTGAPLTIHGDGRQTRSLCYVDDLIEGLWRLVHADCTGPVNLGNPQEVTIGDLAALVAQLSGGTAAFVHTDRPEDDPQVRCPDISVARAQLGWQPHIPLRDGLLRTIAWARAAWQAPAPDEGAPVPAPDLVAHPRR